MLTQERFNLIIGKIEELIADRPQEYWNKPLDPQEVSQLSFAAGGCDYIDARSKNEVFKFLTGMTFNQYISYRVLMYSYKMLLQQNEYNPEALINITGLSSESSLYKKYKETFHLSPKEAFERKIKTLYVEPATWDTLSEQGQDMFVKTVEIIKEVPVEVVKLDKRPYFVVALTIAAVAILCSVIIPCVIVHNRWSGDFVVFRRGTEYNTDTAYITDNHAREIFETFDVETFPKCYELSFSLSPLLKKGRIFNSITNASYDVKIVSLKKDSITFDTEGLLPGMHRFSGTLKEDRSIVLDASYYLSKAGSGRIGDLQITSFRLIRNDDYDQWKNQWDGLYRPTFATSEESNFYSWKLFNNTEWTLSIDIDNGSLNMILINSDGYVLLTGTITYFDGETITVDYIEDGEASPVVFYSLGSGACESVLFSQEWLALSDSLDNPPFRCVKIGDSH